MTTGFLLSEDAAVKQRFSGITVTDDRKAKRPVKVYFRYPEAETERDYPFITIENVGLIHARELQHSEQHYYHDQYEESEGPSSLNYWPSELPSLGSELVGPGYLKADSFVPVYLTYQVATFCRSALHDRQLTSTLLRYVIPFRRGSILVDSDGTARRFDLLGWTNSDLLDQEAGYRKRIFRKVYTLQMTAEIPQSDLESIQRSTYSSTEIQAEIQTSILNSSPPITEVL